MISKRLATVASLIKANMVIADIGSDHAFLPIYLFENNIIKKAYAVDNKVGPLRHAEENIKNAGLNDKIFVYQADGLDELPVDVDCVIIAGMGVDTIVNILEKNIEKIFNLKQLIIQPNTKVHLLRKWINKYKLKILDEQIIEDYKYYQIISIDPQNKGEYDQNEIYFGPVLMNKINDVFKEYHKDQYFKLVNIYKNNPKKKVSEEFEILSENTRLFL